LKEYVFIDQYSYTVDVHFKSEESVLWKITRYNDLCQEVLIEYIDIKVKMHVPYEGVDIIENTTDQITYINIDVNSPLVRIV
jgi:hypothetical protein